MKRIRIVHLISSLKLGGAETVLYTLVRHLDHHHFDHHVIFFHDGPLKPYIESLGIPTYHLKGTFLRYDIVFFLRLLKLLKKLKPDIINSSLWAANFFGTFSARILGIPILCALHTVRAHEGRTRNILDHISLPYANHIIAVSHSIADSLQQQKLLPDSRVTVIPNGLSCVELLDKADKASLKRSDIKLIETDFVIGSVGRFVKVKNYHLLLTCALLLITRYPSVKLVLVGVGPEYEPLVQQAQQLSIIDNIRFIVAKPAYSYYPLFDCFAQPSTYEGLSLALLEALCFKLPSVVTGYNKQHEVINDNHNGLIIKPNDIKELYQALELLYLNAELRIRLGNAGATTVTTQYNLETMVLRYSTLLKGI
jgi:glycosyltransferase involved in cell wall biosynthesis